MKFGSVCSGIEAASVAWGPLGWEAAWLSEIEPFPCAVLHHHYPNVPNLGDMTTLPDRIRSGEVEAPDLFCGGTPCQAFSVAGLRQSLGDARGNLSLTFCGIANAIDDVRRAAGKQPAIIFWENVPGVLSTKDNAFGCFLAGLAGDSNPIEAPQGKWKQSGVVVGPERLAVWRVLDAQYFGVAQRRRRVFVISVSLRHPRAWAIAESLLPLSEGVRGDTAPSREARKDIPGTIEASLNRSRGAGTPTSAVVAARMVAFGEYVDDGTASAMKARDYKDATDLVTQPIGIDEERNAAVDYFGTLKARVNSGGFQGAVAFHNRQDPDISGDITHPIGAQDNGMAVAFAKNQLGEIRTSSIANTLNTNCNPSGRNTPMLHQVMQVRRLTPVERERLQGFPDNYTAIPWRKKPASECPDGPRYKALGNSWAVPVVHWIGKQINAATSISE